MLAPAGTAMVAALAKARQVCGVDTVSRNV